MDQLTAEQIQGIIQKLEAYLTDIKARWDQQIPRIEAWWSINKNHLVISSKFLIECVDELINYVETIIPAGSDKKAAVMAVVSKLFDYIVVQAFPIWLKPFAGTIKDIVVNILISQLVDFIVAKYNAGYWKPQQQEADNGTKK